MNMTLNRHQELHFVVAPTSIMYHSFSCDRNVMYGQKYIKILQWCSENYHFSVHQIIMMYNKFNKIYLKCSRISGTTLVLHSMLKVFSLAWLESALLFIHCLAKPFYNIKTDVLNHTVKCIKSKRDPFHPYIQMYGCKCHMCSFYPSKQFYLGYVTWYNLEKTGCRSQSYQKC